jgi:hypothetical protein
VLTVSSVAEKGALVTERLEMVTAEVKTPSFCATAEPVAKTTTTPKNAKVFPRNFTIWPPDPRVLTDFLFREMLPLEGIFVKDVVVRPQETRQA